MQLIVSMSKERNESRPPQSVRWVVDTPTKGSLRLSVVPQSDPDASAHLSCALTSALDPGVTAILTTFDLGGQFALKNHVDFAVRLDQLRRTLKAVQGLSVWNLHGSTTAAHQNDDGEPMWNARGLMTCFNDVRSCNHATLLSFMSAFGIACLIL